MAYIQQTHFYYLNLVSCGLIDLFAKLTVTEKYKQKQIIIAQDQMLLYKLQNKECMS